MMRGLYIYGIVGGDPGEPLGLGLGGESLEVIGSGSVRAIAGAMPEPPRADPATLSNHDAVVRRLAELFPALLPARFGQWLPDEPSVTGWLSAHGPELTEALAQVAGCVQMTLRVYGDGPAMEGPPEHEPPVGGGPGTQYLAERRQEVERERSLPEIASLREALRPLLRGVRIERPESPGRLRATAYDLIARGAAGAYSRIVSETAPLTGWHVTTSGPWPPYAFAPRPVR
jgi:hypothetical protein